MAISILEAFIEALKIMSPVLTIWAFIYIYRYGYNKFIDRTDEVVAERRKLKKKEFGFATISSPGENN